MTKQMIEVDVPDGQEIEAVTSGVCDNIFAAGPHFHVRLRPAWQWPAWLRARYIAMDKDGDWFGYENNPSIEDAFDTSWCSPGDSIYLGMRLLDFTPPPCDDWTKSLRENPNWKGE